MSEEPKRVSRWFATGFRCAELGREERALPFSQCENEWQRGELAEGFARGGQRTEGGGQHVQFWLVSGDDPMQQIENALGDRVPPQQLAISN